MAWGYLEWEGPGNRETWTGSLKKKGGCKMPYTPGPWEIIPLLNGGYRIVSHDGHGTIATIKVRYSKTDNLNEVKGNAHLIAKSPDLLEALKSAMVIISQHLIESSHCCDDRLNHVKKAIAKAEGRE
jgi:hypothetical protein